MTHLLFEEDGSFKAATLKSETGNSLQIEFATGRRVKIKTSHVMLRFEQPDPTAVMQQAPILAEEIDVDFLWECAPQDEFGFLDLAQEYFGHAPSPVEAAALLLRLHGSPVYFHRKGRGRYRPAPPDILKVALAALERKRQLELRIEGEAQALIEGRLPEGIAAQAAFLLVRPDKQSVEYRALERACERSHLPPERVLLNAGAFGSARGLHLGRFSAEYFPHGTGFPVAVEAEIASLPDGRDLPLAEVEAFSIDDSTTTEIDDCLSVTRRSDGRWRIGIHIAVPAYGIAPGSALDALAEERMSTLYMPGDKVTMLPATVVARYSLDEGREVPALSLYADLDEDGLHVTDSHTVLERIKVAANLRHDLLDESITEAALEGPAEGLAHLPFGPALSVLWRLTLAQSAERDRVRGKPEPRFRGDFSFYIDEGDQVRIVPRRRDQPLDRIVAEMAIFANSTWGRWLAEHKTAAVYRSQQPAGRVRTTTHPLPHIGLGVLQYMWSTSPLRRYVDLINQRQLLAALRGEPAPLNANDAGLFATINAFDARYAGYAEFQSRMERYWCLRWLEQEQVSQAAAVVVRDDLVRLEAVPLFLRMNDLPPLDPGQPITVEILEYDEVDLSVSTRYLGEREGTVGEVADEDPESATDLPASLPADLPTDSTETPPATASAPPGPVTSAPSESA